MMLGDLLTLRNFVWLAGLLQFCQIPAMFAAPKVLGWREDLSKLSAINRNIVLVIGGGIVLTGVGTGLVVVLGATEMVGGGLLGIAFCGFLGVFWFYRLCAQVFLYARIWPGGVLGRLSYYGLTALFTFQAGVYLTAVVSTLLKR